jgi:hypothetical protein
MSKKKKGAIVGGAVGGAVAAWMGGAALGTWNETRKQNKLNAGFKKEASDKYNEVMALQGSGNQWKTDLKNYYGELGEGEQFFNAVSDITQI